MQKAPKLSAKDIQTGKDLLAVYEKRSTCARLSVAAVLMRDGRPVASGWNGVPPGAKHCCDKFADFSEVDMQTLHGHFSMHNEIHAETNAIGFAARNGIATEDTDMFVTYSPCLPCAKQIHAAGIRHVYYSKKYDRDPDGPTFLHKHGILTTDLS